MVGLNGRQLTALLNVRAKLVMRLFWREKGRIVAAFVSLLVFGPLLIGLGMATAFAYLHLEPPWPTQILAIVLVGMWAIWLISPLLLSGINEEADITRLLLYPIARRDLIASILLGTLFDYTTYMMLLLFVAVGIGFSAVWPIVVVALLLAYWHMVIIGQLAQVLLGGLLQSRRFRDVALVLGSLLASTCYLWQLGLQRMSQYMPDSFDEAWLLGLRPLEILQWLPTGALAKAIALAQLGQWLNVALWLLYSLLWVIVLTAVWWFLLERITTGQNFFQFGKPSKPQQPKPGQQRAINIPILPPDTAQLLIKEMKSIWRLPQRRVALLQGLIFPFIMVGASLAQGDNIAQPSEWAGIALPFYALFIFWFITQNMLAWEEYGLATLLLSPVPRQRIFTAKALAFLAVAGLPFLLIAAIVIATSPNWQSVAGFVTGLNVALATLAVTIIASVLFPMRVNFNPKQTRQKPLIAGGGCLAGVASAFLVPLLIALVALPGVAPFALAAWWQRPLLGLIGSVVASLYALLILWGSIKLAGQLLLEREAELYLALKQSEVSE